MPYLTCSDCEVLVFSAARYSTRDACPRCGAVLAPRFDAIAQQLANRAAGVRYSRPRAERRFPPAA